MKKLGLLLFLCLSFSASASTVTLGGWSIHSKENYTNEDGEKVKYNNNHKAIIAEHNGLTGGIFQNSYYEPSVLLGYTARTKHTYVSIAAASGYEDHLSTCLESIKKACVVLFAGIRYKYISVGLMGATLTTSLAFDF